MLPKKSSPRPPPSPAASPSTPCTPARAATSGCRSAAPRSARCSSATLFSYRPRQPRVAEPRSLRPVGRSRLDVPLRVAAPRAATPRCTLDEIKRFRQLDSKTPGHPELTHAPSGVETTTGPARAGHRERGRHGRRREDGRGALQHEGARDLRPPHRLPRRRRLHAGGRRDGGGRVRRPPEARQPDPHLRLERRHARRDGEGDAERGHRPSASRPSASTCRPSTATRWTRSLAAFERAKNAGSGKPQLIIAKTLIGKGIPEVEGTQKAHGEAGAKFAEAARKALGLPAEPYYVSPEVTRVLRRAREGARRRATRRGRRRSRRGRRRTPSSPSSSRCRARTRTRCPKDTAAAHARRRGAPRRHPRVPGGHQDRDAQGRAGRAAAARREGAAAHRRQRRPLRLDAQLHRRPEGRQRRLQGRAPHRAATSASASASTACARS